MKKLFLGLTLAITTQVIQAAPMGKLPIMASRGNCFAVTPVGFGEHNESISYYVNDSHDLWEIISKVKRGSCKINRFCLRL